MKDTEFEEWLADPVTVEVMQYLKDFASAARMEWAQGIGWTEEAAFKVEAFEDLSSLDHESIETFYEQIGAGVEPLRMMRRAITMTENEEQNDEPAEDNTA